MKKGDLEFNYLEFKVLLDKTLGPNSISKLAELLKVARSTVSSWVNGRNKNGPSAKNWDKIIPLFKKRGVQIKVLDFYGTSEHKDPALQQPQVIYGDEDAMTENLRFYMQIVQEQSKLIDLQIDTIKKKDELINQLKYQINELKNSK